jgi:hypothetical protein
MADTIGLDAQGKLIPEVVLNRALLELRNKLYLTQFVVKESDLVAADEITPVKKGKVVNVPKYGTVSRQQRTDYDAPTVNQRSVIGNATFNIDQSWYVRMTTQDIVLALGRDDMSRTHLGKGITALAEGVERDIAAKIVASATKTINGISSGMTEDVMCELREYFLSQNAPLDQRLAFLSGNAMSDLLKIDKYSRLDAYGSVDAIKEGKLQKVQTFSPVESNLVPTSGSPTTYNNFFISPEAAVLAMRPMPTPKNASSSTVVTDPESGLSMRMIEFFDPDLTYDVVQLDILYGVGSYLPELSAIVQTR